MSLPWGDLELSTLRIHGDKHRLYDLERCAFADEPEDPDAALDVVYQDEPGTSASEGMFDLHLLARTLFPSLRDHRLATICEHLDIRCDDACRDEAIALVFQALLKEAATLPKDLIAVLARLLLPPISEVLGQVLLLPATAETPQDVEVESEAATEDADVSLPVSAEEALSPGGPIAGGFSQFEVRDGQLRMAEAVSAAFGEERALLVEAGPGTGKTFAYLVPAMLHLKDVPSDRVIVSTRTRQLQEQLFLKDLPFLVPRVHPSLEVALLKGRENYLCKRKWQSFVAELTESLEHDQLQWVAPLARWMIETETGDIEENSAFLGDPRARGLWNRLNDTSHHCTGAFCPFQEECFSIRARRRARRADLVVVNHSLLLADLMVDGVVLGKYTHVVVDEAHTLESVARMAFTRSLSEWRIQRLADDLSPTRRRRRGWLHRTTFAGGTDAIERVQDLLASLRRTSAEVFSDLGDQFVSDRRAAFDSLAEASDSIEGLGQLLVQLENGLDALVDHVSDPEPLKELEGTIRVVQEMSGTLRDLSHPPHENAVHWYERFTRRLDVNSTPLDIAPFLKRSFYPRVQSLVLTSATLSVGGSFDFLCRTLGLDGELHEVEQLTAESPFDYQERMRILLPRDLPPVYGDLDTFSSRLAEVIADVARTTNRNGLVLFTSYAMLQAVRKQLPEEMNLLVQQESSRTALIDRFREPGQTAWLLGTESFWEGVDFPGSQLEVLVIARLPFPVPTDPVFAALAKKAEAAGNDGFRDLSLPLAALKLRQGVGRLIRTATDHGLVILADERVITRSYGKLVAASLPVPIEQIADATQLHNEVEGWFA